MIRITKKFTFETSHALYGYDGKCKNIHGHSYKLYVTIIGKPVNDINHVKNGMVMDYGDLKKIVEKEIINEWDHSILLNKQSPHIKIANTLLNQNHKVCLVDYQPTSENMLYHIAKKIKIRLPEKVKLLSLKLYETETAYAEWYAKENKD